jgi:hypothetical protein
MHRQGNESDRRLEVAHCLESLEWRATGPGGGPGARGELVGAYATVVVAGVTSEPVAVGAAAPAPLPPPIAPCPAVAASNARIAIRPASVGACFP